MPLKILKLRVRNYRSLRAVDLAPAPFTVFAGGNGSGKSTILDVFAFLSECCSGGLFSALGKRGGYKELRSRGASENEPMSFRLEYRESEGQHLMSYYLAILEQDGEPIVAHEFLQGGEGRSVSPSKIVEFKKGAGKISITSKSGTEQEKAAFDFEDPASLAVGLLGQFTQLPRVVALRKILIGWRLFYLSTQSQRGFPVANPQSHLSESGDNLANVVQFLREHHPDTLDRILNMLQRRIPLLETVSPEEIEDGRLLLQFKDEPFSVPIPAQFVSDGTLKMLSYLLLLYGRDAPPLIGIEEPENFLHPKLLYDLAEECRKAATRSPILVTTHSPEFLNAVKSESVFFLARDVQGYTQILTANDIKNLKYFTDEGGKIGDLWMEGIIRHGDPIL